MNSKEIDPSKKTSSSRTISLEKGSIDRNIAKMTFTGHLGEMRIRMIKSAIAVGVSFCICYAFSNGIIEVLTEPLRGFVIIITGPLEAVLVKLKFSAYGAILLGFPLMMYQMCAFIFPGLKPRERRVVNVLVFGCTTLAVAGALTAFFFVIPLAIPILMSYTPEWVTFMPRLSEILSLVFKAILGFAIAFQFPPVLLTCVYLGMLEPETLKQNRRLAIVILFILAALLTPQDPITMLIMAVPLVILYEISVWISVFIICKKEMA